MATSRGECRPASRKNEQPPDHASPLSVCWTDVRSIAERPPAGLELSRPITRVPIGGRMDCSGEEKAPSTPLSRSELLKRAGVFGAAAAVPAVLRRTPLGRGGARRTAANEGPLSRRGHDHRRRLRAPDPVGRDRARRAEANVVRYIDRALAGDLRAFRPAYTAAVTRSTAYSRRSTAPTFAALAGRQAGRRADRHGPESSHARSASCRTARPCSRCSARTPSRACSATRSTAGTRTSSAGSSCASRPAARDQRRATSGSTSYRSRTSSRPTRSRCSRPRARRY